MFSSGMISSAIACVVGILAAVDPGTFIKVIVILLGALSFFKGLYDLFKVRLFSEDSVYRTSILVRGIICVIVGLLAIILPIRFFNAVSNVIRIMLYVIAVELILAAISNFIMIFRVSEKKDLTKKFSAEGIGYILISVLLFLIPANFGEWIIRIAGIILAVCAAFYAVNTFKVKDKVIEAVEVNVEDDEPEAKAGNSESEISKE